MIRVTGDRLLVRGFDDTRYQETDCSYLGSMIRVTGDRLLILGSDDTRYRRPTARRDEGPEPTLRCQALPGAARLSDCQDCQAVNDSLKSDADGTSHTWCQVAVRSLSGRLSGAAV
eukprot:6695848-Prymnesium_polylepis.1